MSSDKDDDITRIEDLSEFIHEEDDEKSEDFDLFSSDAHELSNQATDPNRTLQSLQDEDDEESEDFEDNFQSLDDEDESSHNEQLNTETTNSEDDFDFASAENFDADQMTHDEDQNFSFNEELDSPLDADNNDLFSEKPTSFMDDDSDDAEPDSINNTYSPSSDLISSDELEEPAAITPPEQRIKTPIPKAVPIEEPKKDEIEQIKVFAENLSYKGYGSIGNPPFSIILKDIRYFEDAQEILDILLKLEVIKTDQQEQTHAALQRGQLLIPRLSEFVAITLCHKFRKFDLDILMGLTEEVNPPKSYESADHGFTSKATLFGNKQEYFEFKTNNPKNEIITSTLNYIEGYQVYQHMGIITEVHQIDEKYLQQYSAAHSQILDDLNTYNPDYQAQKITDENITASKSPYIKRFSLPADNETHTQDGLERIYTDLIEKLKIKAVKKKANAVFGINFSITVSPKHNADDISTYQILCTGNCAWVEKV